MAHDSPVAHYDANRHTYDRIASNIETTHEQFLQASRPVQNALLERSVAFALISIHTNVERHEDAYTRLYDDTTPHSEPNEDRFREILHDATVSYHNRKASWLYHNMVEADTDSVVDLIEAGEYGTALRATVQEYHGVSMAKGAYALANLGVPKMACIDRHVARASGLDPKTDVYEGIVPEKYFAQWNEIEAQYPTLRGKMPSRFAFQWVLFDWQRDTVTTHDAWFDSLPIGVEPVSVEAVR